MVVLIFGFTGIIGKLVTVPALILVWYRLAIAVAAIAIYLRIRKTSLTTTLTLTKTSLAIGILVGLHWVFFFHAIKISSVSVTLICLASAPFMIAVLEPVVFRSTLRPHELLFSILNLAGIAIIYKFEVDQAMGIAYALLAALLSAIFTILNGRLIRSNDSSLISFYELIGALITLSIIAPVWHPISDAAWKLSSSDWFYLFILGTICTAFAYMASIHILKVISPFNAMLTVNLEPVYGILMAIAIFGNDEKMSPEFYLGAGIVLSTIYLNGAVNRKQYRKQSKG